jgi:hypothetical protein
VRSDDLRTTERYKGSTDEIVIADIVRLAKRLRPEVAGRVERDARRVLAAMTLDLEVAAFSLLDLVAVLTSGASSPEGRLAERKTRGAAGRRAHWFSSVLESADRRAAVIAAMDETSAKPTKGEAYAALIRPAVLKALGKPARAKSPSLITIRREIVGVLKQKASSNQLPF